MERYPQVIELFRSKHADAPATLEILCADGFTFIQTAPAEGVDGIFFDPALWESMWNDGGIA